MQSTRLSSKGQVIIPKDVRRRKRWKPGQELDVIETQDGIVLRPRKVFPVTSIEDLGKSLQYRGPRIPTDQLNSSSLTYHDPYERSVQDDGD